MLTPFFRLTQDEKTISVYIRAANANLRDTQIEYLERTFLFTSTPYFLQLYLTGDVEAGEGDGETTKYDADEGFSQILRSHLLAVL